MRTRFFLGEVADTVIRANRSYYLKADHRFMDSEYAFADLIPDELLNTEFHSYADCIELSKRLDQLRFEKQKELANILKSADPERLNQVINSPLNTLPPEQEEKRKEIKFLANVGMTLLHWTHW